MSGPATLTRWWPLPLAPAAGAARGLLAWGQDRLAAERGRLALWLPVALACGILGYFALPREPAADWLWLALPGPVLAWALGRRWPYLGWAAGLLAMALLGAALAGWQAARQPPALELPRGATQL